MAMYLELERAQLRKERNYRLLGYGLTVLAAVLFYGLLYWFCKSIGG